MAFDKKKVLVAAAIAGIMASSTVAMAGSAFPGGDSMNKSHCSKNGCKSMNGCKGKEASCKGQHSCKGGNSCKSAAAATEVVDGALKTS